MAALLLAVTVASVASPTPKIIIQVEAVRPIRLQRVTGAQVAKPHPLPSSHRPTSNSQSRATTDRAVSIGLVAGHTI